MHGGRGVSTFFLSKVTQFFEVWAEYLISEPPPQELIAAGIEKLNDFDWLNKCVPVITITGKDIDTVLELPANVFYSVLSREALSNNISTKAKKYKDMFSNFDKK